MKIYNTKNIADFEDTLKEIKSRLNIEIDFNSISSNCYRVKLVKKKENKNYQRTGFYNNKNGTPRKVNAICWHGFRDFFKELYEHYNTLRVVTSSTTYTSIFDFYKNYNQTGYKNIGSMIQPLQYNKACLCDE